MSEKTFKIVDGDISDGYHTFEELYEHRITLFLTLMKLIDTAWYSKFHSDGTAISGWFIAGINFPHGGVTYHLPQSAWCDAAKTGAKCLEFAPEWDGHTSEDVLKRLRSFIQGEP